MTTRPATIEPVTIAYQHGYGHIECPCGYYAEVDDEDGGVALADARAHAKTHGADVVTA